CDYAELAIGKSNSQVLNYKLQISNLMTIQENVPLAPLTTLQVGGAARYFAELKREDDVREAAQFASTRDLPLFVLGGGSNLLVADSGWPGLVLRIGLGGITTPNTTDASGNAVLFSVGAGVNWDDFVAQAVVQNSAGVECLSGIPGSAGGTPVQNVGAYGQEVSDTIESVRAFDLKQDRIVVLPKPACGFRYRTSIFNSTDRGRYVILRVNYRLKRGGKEDAAIARRSARGRAHHTPEQRYAARPRRRRLPQRRILLQESCAHRGTVQRTGRTRRIQRPRDSQLPRTQCTTQSCRGLAGGTFRVLQGIRGRSGRHLTQTCASPDQPRSRESKRYSQTER